MSADGHTLTVLIPLTMRPRGGRKAIITPGALAVESRHDVTLIKTVARGFRLLRMPETERFATITELAAVEKINSSYVARILRLTLLASEVVEAILDGRQPAELGAFVLREGIPVEWREQRGHWLPGRPGASDIPETDGDTADEHENWPAGHR